MAKSDAISKIDEYCYSQLSCEGCKCSYIDENDYCMCLLDENPKKWKKKKEIGKDGRADNE